MSLRRTDATVGGIRCPVLQGGSDDASDAVVFVHGNPGSSEDWRPFLRAQLEGAPPSG